MPTDLETLKKLFEATLAPDKKCDAFWDVAGYTILHLNSACPITLIKKPSRPEYSR